MQSLTPSHVSSPQFSLDLGSQIGSGIDGFRGLQFPHPPSRTRGPEVKVISAVDSIKDHTVTISTRVMRTMWMMQGIMVLILTLLIGGLLYWAYRLNYSVNWYYDAAQPYLEEMRMRGMSMVRHADNSSAALEQVMVGAEVLTSTSIPALMDSVNRTTAMVARLEQVARNPTIKLSMA
jgi:hypothetical protein